MLIFKKFFLALLGLFVTALVAPATAVAAPAPSVGAGQLQRETIPLVWNTGQEIFLSGPLPEPYRSASDAAGWQAGYYCDVVGVLWSDFSVRNCEAAAINGNKIINKETDPEMVSAIEAAYPTMRRGVWNRYGWVLILAVIVVGLGLRLRSRLGRANPEPSAPTESAEPGKPSA